MKQSSLATCGGLIWITGFSGSGKTTIASLVGAKLRAVGRAVVVLDGDEIRSILGERYGHDLDERKQLANVYGRLCKKIADSGVTVVIAAVAMFESVRRENRISNDVYLEVYLDVPLDIRQDRDPKGLYRAAAVSKKDDGKGLVVGFEEPVNPDVVIKNYGEITADSAAAMVVEHFLQVNVRVPDISEGVADAVRQKSNRSEYWDKYYGRRKAPIVPSPFALFCNENYLKSHCHILEFGCGNGRDSFFFSKAHRVTAIDESGVVIQANRERALQEGILNVEFLHGAFGNEIKGQPETVDAVYARFVIHAMPEEAESAALRMAWKILKEGGVLLLEFRTIHDPLINQGEKVGDSERVTDHYRRFIDFQKFCEKLQNIGFSVQYALEKQGLARYGDDDPVVGRVVAAKSGN